MLWSSLAALSFPLLCIAAIQNITIDDTQTVGDQTTGAHIVYYVSDQWCACNPQANCTEECLFEGGNPDTSIALDNTWHQGGNGEANVKVDVLFTGTAVYVYTILSDVWPANDITFMMNGKTASHYNQTEAARNIPFIETFASNYLMFSATGLSSTQHNLTIAIGLHQKADNKVEDLSMLILDYVIYSFESNITSSSTTPISPTPAPSIPPANPIVATTHSKTPVIVGSVIGTIAAVFIILSIFLCYLQIKKRRRERPTTIPFDTQEYRPSTTISINNPGGSKGVFVSDSTSGSQTRTASPYDTSNPSGSSGEQQSEGRSQPTMGPMNATMSLAAEVQRLRGEIDRLDRTRSPEVQEDAHGTFPPPYQDR